MTDRKRAAYKRLIDLHTRKTTVSREVAKASLVRQGIHTQDGKLTPEYAAEGRKAARA